MSSKRIQMHHRELLAYLKWKAKDRMLKWRDKYYLPFIEARTFVRWVWGGVGFGGVLVEQGVRARSGEDGA